MFSALNLAKPPIVENVGYGGRSPRMWILIYDQIVCDQMLCDQIAATKLLRPIVVDGRPV